MRHSVRLLAYRPLNPRDIPKGQTRRQISCGSDLTPSCLRAIVPEHRSHFFCTRRPLRVPNVMKRPISEVAALSGENCGAMAGQYGTAAAQAATYPAQGSNLVSTPSLLDLGVVERSTLPNHITTDSRHVLIVGDGDFSYARAFCRSIGAPLPGISITATSYDSADELLQRYPRSLEVVLDLKENFGVVVRHCIDATKIGETLRPSSRFDRIVFNFPHFPPTRGNRNKIQKHRELLAGFFLSCHKNLSEGGEVWVTLAPGQGGTEAELQEEKREWSNHWQIVAQAALSGFVLVDVHVPPMEALNSLGYTSTGFRLRQQGFRVRGALTHVFCRDTETGPRPALYGVKWRRDISFHVDSSFSTDDLIATSQGICERYGVEVSVEQFDEFTNPETHVRSVGFRMFFHSATKAVCKPLANYLAKKIQAERIRRFVERNRSAAESNGIVVPDVEEFFTRELC